MPTYRVTIFGKDYDAMADIVRRHGIFVFRQTVGALEGVQGYMVDAMANADQIASLEASGYRVERHEDLEEVGKARQSEVGRGDRYSPNKPLG